jgi:hypothetical protein
MQCGISSFSTGWNTLGGTELVTRYRSLPLLEVDGFSEIGERTVMRILFMQ